LLTTTVPDLVQRDVYMCGPPGLTKALRQAMLGAGLPVRQLHEERFTF
jgi:ferredoxin-NADP reductase